MMIAKVRGLLPGERIMSSGAGATPIAGSAPEAPSDSAPRPEDSLIGERTNTEPDDLMLPAALALERVLQRRFGEAGD